MNKMKDKKINFIKNLVQKCCNIEFNFLIFTTKIIYY
jgi:hypothetical protein